MHQHPNANSKFKCLLNNLTFRSDIQSVFMSIIYYQKWENYLLENLIELDIRAAAAVAAGKKK